MQLESSDYTSSIVLEVKPSKVSQIIIKPLTKKVTHNTMTSMMAESKYLEDKDNNYLD